MLRLQRDDESGILTVSGLNSQIKALLENKFPFVWVKGEISNFRVPASGHYYFTLKDSGSQINAVFFRAQNRYLRFVPESGMQVLCQARLSVYEPRGDYQLIVEVLEPLGAGQLQLAFENLKKKLDQEGLFEPARKKALPLCPLNVCVVTSSSGAALRDILKVLEASPYPVGVTILPVAVQGGENLFRGSPRPVVKRQADIVLGDAWCRDEPQVHVVQRELRQDPVECEHQEDEP
jgi:exodeoxyribonuclease VII large subunit